MQRELLGDPRGQPWVEATRRPRKRSETTLDTREPSAGRQREDLAFAFATRAVEALEDPAFNVAAIRERLERTDPQAAGARARGGGARPERS